MTWANLREDIADLFDDDDRRDDAEIAELDPRHGLRRVDRGDPPPHTKTGRVLLAVVGGARTPAAVAAVTGLHRLDVVSYLKTMRQHGRVACRAEGWVTS